MSISPSVLPLHACARAASAVLIALAFLGDPAAAQTNPASPPASQADIAPQPPAPGSDQPAATPEAQGESEVQSAPPAGCRVRDPKKLELIV